MAFPTSLDTNTPSAGTSKLSSPDHSDRHNVIGSAVVNIEAKVGINAGSPTLNRLLVGSGNGQSSWGTQVNNLGLGTPTIGTANMKGGTLATAIVGTSTVQGGTVANALVGTSTIQGGTANNQVVGTPSVTGGTFTNPALAGTISGNAFLDEDTMSSNSDIKVASQQSIKAYVDTQVAAIGGVWGTYSPTWGNVTVGNGTSVGYFKRIGKTTFFRAYLTWGSSTSASGGITVTIPGTMIADYNRSGYTEQVIGLAGFLDSGAAAYPGQVTFASTTTVTPRALKADATYTTQAGISSTIPFTFGSADEIWVNGIYEEA